MKDIISKERHFAQPIEKVWSAISKGEELSKWFIKADFKAEIGYQYTFHASSAEDCTDITGVVKRAEPYTLVYSWKVQNTEVETVVKWILEKTQEGTRLLLEHSGIASYKGETAVTMFSSFDKGWDNCVSELLAYLKQEVHAG